MHSPEQILPIGTQLPPNFSDVSKANYSNRHTTQSIIVREVFDKVAGLEGPIAASPSHINHLSSANNCKMLMMSGIFEMFFFFKL